MKSGFVELETSYDLVQFMTAATHPCGALTVTDWPGSRCVRNTAWVFKLELLGRAVICSPDCCFLRRMHLACRISFTNRLSLRKAVVR